MLKGKICLGLISLFLTNVSFAKDKLSIELSLKPQITTFIGNNDFLNSETIQRQADFKLGYGLDIDFHLIEKISVGLGVHYNPQGIEEETLNYEHSFHADMKYLRIPLNFKYHFLHTENYNLSFSIGIGYNYLLDVNDNLWLTIGFISGIISDPQERYNEHVIDAGLSVEYDYKILDRLYLISKIEGIIGLSRFHAPYRIASNANVDINSRMLSVGICIGVGYLF